MSLAADVATQVGMNKLNMARPYNKPASGTPPTGYNQYVSAPGAARGILQYTSPEFRFALTQGARDYLSNVTKVQKVTQFSADASKAVGLGPSYYLGKTIYLEPNAPQWVAEHESIHALSNFLGQTALSRTIGGQISPDLQQRIRQNYPRPLPGVKFEQEAPPVLWDMFRNDPVQLSLYNGVVDYFKQFMNPSVFMTSSERRNYFQNR